MVLDDPHQIQQTLATNVKEVEVMYWLVEDAIHNGNLGRAKSIYNMLLYVAKYKKDLIRDGLKAPQRSRLQNLAHELHGDGMVKKCLTVEMRKATSQKKIPFKTEKELQDHLHKNSDILSQAFREDVKVMGQEVDVGDDYRCDLVAESQSTLYPIELKIAQGTHSVVSQCSKYCYYFYRKMRYDRFKTIQGIVIANGFDAWSVNELRKEGHLIFEIMPDGKSISLSQITNHATQ